MKQNNHPDADIIADYEAFHAFDLAFNFGPMPAECRGDREKEDAWGEAGHNQWCAMLKALMLRQPQTHAGMAVLTLALLHSPELHEIKTDPDYATWDGYSIPPGLNEDYTTRYLAHIAAYALRLAPELRPGGDS